MSGSKHVGLSGTDRARNTPNIVRVTRKTTVNGKVFGNPMRYLIQLEICSMQLFRNRKCTLFSDHTAPYFGRILSSPVLDRSIANKYKILTSRVTNQQFRAFAELILGNVRIDLRSCNAVMSQEFLDFANIICATHQVEPDRMA